MDPKRTAASPTTTPVDSSIAWTKGSVIDTVLGSRVVESGAVEEGIGVVVDPMNSSSDPLMQTVARIDVASTEATMEAQT